MFLDPTFILIIPPLLLALWAQSKVRSTFQEYSQHRARSGWNGRQVARAMLDAAGLGDVPVEQTPGQLTDHYDPSKRVLKLSEPVYNSSSLAALGVAAHEAGHALQDARDYTPLKLRQAIWPAAAFGSNLGPILAMVGIMLAFFTGGWTGAIWVARVGIAIFAVATVFTVLTLPVELNASRRALQALTEGGFVERDERVGAKKVLDAAALTYMAAAFMSVMMLLRFILLLSAAQRD
jgi:Zn-dependent membrane protease YugP